MMMLVRLVELDQMLTCEWCKTEIVLKYKSGRFCNSLCRGRFTNSYVNHETHRLATQKACGYKFNVTDNELYDAFVLSKTYSDVLKKSSN